MLDLYKSESFRTVEYKDHSEWLLGRKETIGGSDSSCMVNANPWKTLKELWYEKQPQFEPKEEMNEAMKYGTNAESHIRALFQLKHPELDVQYKPDTTLVSNKYDFMSYSPDGLILDGDKKGILEIKTSKIMNHEMMSKWGNKDDPKVPENYYIQTLHGLIVTGYDFVIFCAELRFLDNEARIIERSFEREDVENDIQYLLYNEKKNWNKYFATHKKPNFEFEL